MSGHKLVAPIGLFQRPLGRIFTDPRFRLCIFTQQGEVIWGWTTTPSMGGNVVGGTTTHNVLKCPIKASKKGLSGVRGHRHLCFFFIV